MLTYLLKHQSEGVHMVHRLIVRLIQPLVENWEWQLRAACRGKDPAVFFHPDKETRKERARRLSRARVICNGCPVQLDCYSYALTAREPYGIWGGLGEHERTKIVAEHRASSR